MIFPNKRPFWGLAVGIQSISLLFEQRERGKSPSIQERSERWVEKNQGLSSLESQQTTGLILYTKASTTYCNTFISRIGARHAWPKHRKHQQREIHQQA